jgi:phage recombination protein Bet
MNNTTAVQKTQPQQASKPSALGLMASRLSCDPSKLLATLKATVFKGANDEEVMALCLVANEYHLNPLLKELYAFQSKGGGITPIVSVDGWNKMLLRQERYDGKKFTFEVDGEGRPISCTATIFVKGRDHAEEITEYLVECQRNTDNWKNMPFRMLRNRTLCQASRMAFGFSGVYHEEEVPTVDVSSETTPAEPPPKLVAAPVENQITPQAELEGIITAAGYSFDDLVKWGDASGVIQDAGSLANVGEVPTDVAKRILKAQKGLLTGLAAQKEGLQ